MQGEIFVRIGLMPENMTIGGQQFFRQSGCLLEFGASFGVNREQLLQTHAGLTPSGPSLRKVADPSKRPRLHLQKNRFYEEKFR